MFKNPIYFDNHSTTKLEPRVLDAMLPYLNENFGNASSQHFYGFVASEAVSIARKKIAKLINSLDEEIIFTSGATESNNLALKGITESYSLQGNHIITSKVEHSSVLDVCEKLKKKGIQVTYLSVDINGAIDLNELENSITDKTILVSIIFGNNEVGTIQQIKKISEVCHSKGVLFHTDATQCVGNIPVNVKELNVDLMSFTAHKIHGPKGIGALYVKTTTPKIFLSSQIDGGGQEKNIRSGTLNVPAIIGFGKAAEICSTEMENNSNYVLQLRNLFEEKMKLVDGIKFNGDKNNRLPNNSHITLKNVKIKNLLRIVKSVVFSTHAACSSTTGELSHVLKAIGMPKNEIESSARFGFSKMNTKNEILEATDILINAIGEIRKQTELQFSNTKN